MAKIPQKIRGGKKGFTLVELLIVIFIMAILTVLAVSSYAMVQQQARIDFAADTLAAVLREAQTLAKSGSRIIDSGVLPDGSAESLETLAGAGKLQCFGVKIVSGVGEDSGLYTAQSAYVGLPSSSADKVDSCEAISSWRKVDIFDGNILIRNICAGGTCEENGTQVFYFKPPFAKVLQEDGVTGLGTAAGLYEYRVGVFDKADLDKKLQFDLATGLIKRI